MKITKNYINQPNENQMHSIRINWELGMAINAAKKLNEDFSLTLETNKRATNEIVATVKSAHAFATASFGKRGKAYDIIVSEQTKQILARS